MTLLAIAEPVQRVLTEHADEVLAERTGERVIYTAMVGKQAFLVTIEELAKDDQEPSLA